MHGGLAADRIRQRAIERLAHRQAEKHCRDDELHVVGGDIAALVGHVDRVGRGLLAQHACRTTDCHRQIDRIGQSAVGEERAGADRAPNPGELLIDHATGTEIEVADLRVAHLPTRQADCRARGANHGVWIGCPETVPNGRFRRVDRIVVGVTAQTPAVKDQEKRWAYLVFHCVSHSAPCCWTADSELTL